MSTLQNLKLVTAKKMPVNAVTAKRNKLANKLQEQIELIAAKQAGQRYTRTRVQWISDDETGTRTAVEVPKRVREWFWTANTGKVNV